MILFHLATNGPTYSIEFEKPKNSSPKNITNRFYDDGYDRSIPHSTLRKIFQEFLHDGIVEKISTIERSPRGLLLSHYGITFLGLKKLFSIIREGEISITLRNMDDIVISSQQLIPWISKNWNKLTEIYDKVGMFDLMVRLSENINVSKKDVIQPSVGSKVTSISWIKDGYIIEEMSKRYKNVDEHLASRLTIHFIHYLIESSVRMHSESIVRSLKIDSVTRLLHLIKTDAHIWKRYSEHIKIELRNSYEEIKTLKKISSVMVKIII